MQENVELSSAVHTLQSRVDPVPSLREFMHHLREIRRDIEAIRSNLLTHPPSRIYKKEVEEAVRTLGRVLIATRLLKLHPEHLLQTTLIPEVMRTRSDLYKQFEDGLCWKGCH